VLHPRPHPCGQVVPFVANAAVHGESGGFKDDDKIVRF
jgi:hypothetical protein